MISNILALTIGVWGVLGQTFLPFTPEGVREIKKLHDLVDPLTLEGSVGRPLDSMYLVVVELSFKGDFVTLKDGQPHTTYTSAFQGNAFAVDDWGRLMTNAHVVNPPDLFLDAFLERDPKSMKKFCACQVKSVQEATVEYTIADFFGNIFSTKYQVFADWTIVPEDPCPVAVSNANPQPISFGKTGRVRLKQVSSYADLAIITIPSTGQPFLKFGELSKLGVGGETYSYALRSLKDDGLEVHWGRLQIPCVPKVIQEREEAVARFLMFGEFGKSGSALLSPNGLVVAVLTAKDSLPYNQPVVGTYGIPAGYAREFYLWTVGRRSTEPELDCQTCGLVATSTSE